MRRAGWTRVFGARGLLVVLLLGGCAHRPVAWIEPERAEPDFTVARLYVLALGSDPDPSPQTVGPFGWFLTAEEFAEAAATLAEDRPGLLAASWAVTCMRSCSLETRVSCEGVAHFVEQGSDEAPRTGAVVVRYGAAQRLPEPVEGVAPLAALQVRLAAFLPPQRDEDPANGPSSAVAVLTRGGPESPLEGVVSTSRFPVTMLVSAGAWEHVCRHSLASRDARAALLATESTLTPERIERACIDIEPSAVILLH